MSITALPGNERESRLSEQKNFMPKDELWFYTAAAFVVIIIVAAIRWSLAHPFGIHWDEALYFNDVAVDVQRLRSGMLAKLAGRILIKSWGRPPAFRILALPFLGVVGFHPTAARLVSLACYALSSLFVYLTARRMAGPVAGAVAALIFALSPEVVSASIFFSTDAPLYLATSAMLYYLFESWRNDSEHPRAWIGLGLAVGLGFLAKASFLAICVPVFVFWLGVSLSRRWSVPAVTSQWKAAVLAFAVAGPWWLLNFKAAAAMAQMGRDFVRNSLGTPSLTTFVHWLSTVCQALLGHGVTLFLILILIASIRVTFSKSGAILDSSQRLNLAACACAGVPIVLAQLSGTNHLLRHISPAVVPLAIAFGVLFEKSGLADSRTAVVVGSALLLAQLLMIVSPVVFPNDHPVDIGFPNGSLPWRVMPRFEQWDLKALPEISDGCGLRTPKLAYLGGGREFDPPHLEYPWIARIPSTHRETIDLPEVNWLWRSEQGPIDWQRVMESAALSDIVVVAPHFVGEGKYEALDNQYNLEFAQRLSGDPQFQGPIRLEVGRFEPIEVDVFENKSLTCHPVPQVSSSKQ